MNYNGSLKFGERIPVEKFHVSKWNVRFGNPFGKSEEDQYLIANLKKGKIIEPFIVRSEKLGYGIIVGRRRFLAKKINGTKEFVFGKDFLIDDISDEEAREESLIENLAALRKEMDPISRAKALNTVMAFLNLSLRAAAKRLGIPKSNLSDWLQVLNLTSKLQKAMIKNQLNYTDGLRIARLQLDERKQDELAELLEAEGQDALRKEIARIPTGKKKRGVPKGAYELARVLWDRRDKNELRYYNSLSEAAKKKSMDVPDYLKDLVKRNIEKIENGTI